MATPGIQKLPDMQAGTQIPQERLRERGMILVTTLLFLSLVTVLCSAAVVRTASDIREGGAQRIGQAALRLSEAGAMGTVARRRKCSSGSATT